MRIGAGGYLSAQGRGDVGLLVRGERRLEADALAARGLGGEEEDELHRVAVGRLVLDADAPEARRGGLDGGLDGALELHDRARHVAVDLRDVREAIVREVAEGPAPRVEQPPEVRDDAALAVGIRRDALDPAAVREGAAQHVVEAGFHSASRKDAESRPAYVPKRTGAGSGFRACVAGLSRRLRPRVFELVPVGVLPVDLLVEEAYL